jgi:hypothetical protein
MIRNVPMDRRKGLNSLVILVAWEIWKHRNPCVLEGVRLCISIVLQAVWQLANESSSWCLVSVSAQQVA